MAFGTKPSMPESGQRRRVVRVRTELNVVVASADGEKQQARVLDVGTGGMHLMADTTPTYGQPLTVIVRLAESSDWTLLPATVRWFSGQGFGVEFDDLDETQGRALAEFVDRAAA